MRGFEQLFSAGSHVNCLTKTKHSNYILGHNQLFGICSAIYRNIKPYKCKVFVKNI